LIAVLLAGFVPAASAQDPTQEGYAAPGGTEQLEVAPTQQTGAGPSPGAAGDAAAAGDTGDRRASGGFLPFSGWDLGFAVLAGGMLLLVGVGLRRLSRQER
jgi:hypothetical protein